MSLQSQNEITTKEVEKALEKVFYQTDKCMKELGVKFKSPVSINNTYQAAENTDWTPGFYTGELWICYELTQNEKYKNLAMKHVDSFFNRIENQIETETHDLGFLYSLSCVAGYKLTGNETAKKAALMAADKLLTRFHEKGQFIQAWGNLEDKNNYRLIIDCLLNLPLLYWASEVTGDFIYKNIADKHCHTTLKVILRPDYSTHHTFFFDSETGKPLKGVTNQGYSSESAWARGQAWGIYGMALSYRYTKYEEYKDAFRKVTDFFLKHLPDDLVPYWDLCFDGGEEPRDSSSAAIAVCGMLEMSKYLSKEEAEYYVSIAKKLMKSLVHGYTPDIKSSCNGQLLHSTYGKSSPYNEVQDVGVDECTTWGDYFYEEALIRLKKDWKLYW